MTELYPHLEPYDTFMLPVGDGHTLYVEQSGNPDGKPVIVLHGGPGGGTSPKQRRFFDPDAYRIVIMAQRGSGASTPTASVEHNTTWDLVADIEKVRERVGVERWTVFGGSWGSTLALAYAQTHPGRVLELVLRGIFLLRRVEIDFFYQSGTSFLFPDEWEHYVAPIPEDERHDLVAAHHRRLFGDDPEAQMASARAWAGWERATAFLDPTPTDETDLEMLTLARIENHYFTNRGFFDHEDQLLDGIDVIRDIPAVIVQGRYDCVCPMRTAWDLHRVWPEAELVVNDRAGHSAFDPQNASALVEACDRFSQR
ncbi:MAG: prolyl aminopeptidase [Acidimicrobiales bacterium]